jgi:hypothetical protein
MLVEKSMLQFLSAISVIRHCRFSVASGIQLLHTPAWEVIRLTLAGGRGLEDNCRGAMMLDVWYGEG